MHEHDILRAITKQQAGIKVNTSLKQRLAQKFAKTTPITMPYWSSRKLAGASILAVLVLVIVFSSHQKQQDDWTYEATGSSEQRLGLASSIGSQVSISSGGQALGNASAPMNLAAGIASVGSSLKQAVGLAPKVVADQFAASPQANQARGRADAEIGLAVGGAKDIANFREHIKRGYMPQATDLTVEGLFNDYYFDTGAEQPCDQLFCPSFARAVASDQSAAGQTWYLSVGLNSNLKPSDLKRPNTDIVIVLDISGSMGEQIPSEGGSKNKLEVAIEAVQAILDKLRPADRLGIVLFSDQAHIAKPISNVSETDISSLKKHLSELRPTNGTNMSAGIEKATELLRETPAGSAKRVIFVTDAMPNQGSLGRSSLQELAKNNEQAGISMTFVGLGVDFQTDLVETLTKIRGANYVSLHSSSEVQENLVDQFENLITPLVYDVRLDFAGTGFQIEKIYGSPDTDISSGNLLHIRTLFPSKKQNSETRGGIVLLKLKKTGEQPRASLRVQYLDRELNQHESRSEISFAGLQSGSYDNLGIRKGVVLSQYADLLHTWLGKQGKSWIGESGGWERNPQPLEVSPEFRSRFQSFAAYLKNEMVALHDSALEQEQRILQQLSSVLNNQPYPVDTHDDWRW